MSENALPNNPKIKPSELEALHNDGWRWARSLVGDSATVDDVMQRTYEELLTGRAYFAGNSLLKTWLFGVIRNVAYSHFRSERRGFKLLTKLRSLGASEEVAVPEPTDHVSYALLQLPARQREVLELVIYRDFTLEECAKIIGISVGSVRTHYHRAKTSLRSYLENEHAS